MTLIGGVYDGVMGFKRREIGYRDRFRSIWVGMVYPAWEAPEFVPGASFGESIPVSGGPPAVGRAGTSAQGQFAGLEAQSRESGVEGSTPHPGKGGGGGAAPLKR